MQCRGGILGGNPDRSLKSFPPCYSQTPLLIDCTPHLLFFGLEISTSNSWEGGRGQYNLKIGVGIGGVDNWNFDQLCGKLTISKKVAQSVIFNLLFYTYKSFLGSCLRDCKVKIAEKYFLEAATGLLRLCTP